VGLSRRKVGNGRIKALHFTGDTPTCQALNPGNRKPVKRLVEDNIGSYV